MHKQYDLVILGAGLSGLSIAYYLSRYPNWPFRTLLIDKRTTYENDKSFCFWLPKNITLDPGMEALISQRWSNWQMAGKTHRVTQQPYAYIAAQDFYQFALSSIKQHQQISLCLGKEITNIQPVDGAYQIETTDEKIILANKIIDTRPPIYTEAKQSKLWQIFFGYELENTDIYAPSDCIGLMNALQFNELGTLFHYILPFKDHTLIETTLMTNRLISPNQLQPYLERYIQQELKLPSLPIRRIETGILPMGLHSNQPLASNQYYYAGTAGGALKASTGYGFLRIQKEAQLIAHQLKSTCQFPKPQHKNNVAYWMDDIFLSVCHRRPQLMVSLFERLAHRVHPERLVRFLQEDDTKTQDYLAIILAMPKLKFLHQAIKHAFTI